MGKNKLKKFAKVEEMSHVIQPEFKEVFQQDYRLKGKWHQEFGNDHPIVLELACGKGEYSVGMGEIFPDKNFIGIDIKGARMFTGAKQVEEKGLKNVRFLRTKIDLITAFFAENEIDEIWILFADPQMKKPRKRLTSRLFLQHYIQILRPEGTLHLKSDSDDLYSFTKEVSVPEFNAQEQAHQWKLEFDTNELYEEGIKALSASMQQVMHIKTYYEQMWLEQGKKIKYLRYQLKSKAN